MAAHLAVLHERALDVRLDVDRAGLAAVGTLNRELVVQAASSGSLFLFFPKAQASPMLRM